VRRADVIAIAVRSAAGTAVLVALAVGAHSAYATVPVVIDGSRVTVPRGTEVRDLVREYSGAHAGDLLSAADLRVVAKGAGRPVTALVNGTAAPSSAIVERGDTVSTSSGADLVESLVEETRTVDASPKVIGDGPVATIVAPGDAGVELCVRGAVSGDVFAVETVREARPAVVRRSPLPGTRVVALTFDDGPWPRQTAEVLKILADKGVPATFFMVGSCVKVAPGLARAVAEEGHVIGSHTFWHPHLDTLPTERVVREISAGSHAIKEATGVTPYWFRAPAGRLDARVMNAVSGAGMRSALWTVDPQDWRDSRTADDIVAQVVGAVHPGAIVVLHDGGGDQTETIKALPRIIDALRAQGYQFVTLDDLDFVKSAW
jgi:peptidoglycan/xylan/chitin deacetylase (PgdA/CDA1 family)